MTAGPVVAVDARALTEQRTGIGVWVAEIVMRWHERGREVRLLVEEGRQHDLPLRTIELPPNFHLRAARTAWRHNWHYLSPWSFIAPSLLGRSCTVAVHDMVPVLHPEAQIRRTRLAFQLFLAPAARRAGALVVPSEATKTDLLRAHPAAAGRVHVVPEAPRQLPPATVLPPEVQPPYLLFVGTLEPRKHAVDLAEAFVAVAPEPWQLVLAGKRGWLAPEEHVRMDRLAAHPRVHELGYVSNETLSGLLQGAAGLAYPSAYEGFGLPVLEAMAAGVPVLTTTTPAIAEVAGGAAEMVDLLGPDPYGAGLREAIGRFLADDRRRAELAAAGRRRASEFDWDTCAERMWSIVSALPAPRR